MGTDSDQGQRQLTVSEARWLQEREYLQRHRYELALEAASAYPETAKVAGTPLLASNRWIPATPIPVQDIALDLVDEPFGGGTGTEQPVRTVLPQRSDGSRYGSYADVIAALAAPAVFEDRPTYRLREADLSTDNPWMRFGRGSYFDFVNTGEAAAHEYASAKITSRQGEGLRDVIGDPCDPTRRPVNVAISTLTIRVDKQAGTASYLLHWRDPSKVGHAGGMYQVVPVGIFQPSGLATGNEVNDFFLWRNIIRELAEELLGQSEDHGSDLAPIDYAAWPFAARMNRELSKDSVRVHCLGMGVDPLTFATDLLTAVAIDAEVFDEIFGDVVSDNAEGRLLAAQPFEKTAVDTLLNQHPMQAAGAAVLRLGISQLSLV